MKLESFYVMRLRCLIVLLFIAGILSLSYIVFDRTPTLFRNVLRVNGNFSKHLANTKVNEMRVWIPNNYSHSVSTCRYTLDLPQNEILKKISSYHFPGVDHYIADLFPQLDDHVLPQNPIFVTGISSNHSEEGLAMIRNFNTMINAKKSYKLIVFDIGLTDEENKQVKDKCNCEVRPFPFQNFPDHVRILKGYAWKPLVMQLVARTHPFVVWLDASIRFTTTDIHELLQRAKHYGIITRKGKQDWAYRTSIETFRYLNEPPCLYLETNQSPTGFVIIYQTRFIRTNLMIPWVSCALIRGCMVPHKDVFKILKCHKGDTDFFQCHRFEQSVLGILVNRLFSNTTEKLYIPYNGGKYLRICRNCKN